MLQDKVIEIAGFFPEFPTVSKLHENRYSIHPPGRTDVGFDFWVNYRKRISISGIYPRSQDDLPHSMFMPYGAEMPSITVSITRSAQAIANDIKRRFYDKYKILYPVIVIKIVKHDANLDRVAAAKKLITDNTLSQLGYKNEIYSMKTGAANSWHGKIHKNGQVRLELDYLDLETAMTILLMLEK